MIDGLGTWLGEFNTDGSIKTDAVNCAVTGKPLKSIHAVRERIPGTSYFIRILSDVYNRVTDDERQAIYNKVAKTPAEPVKEAKGKKEA